MKKIAFAALIVITIFVATGAFYISDWSEMKVVQNESKKWAPLGIENFDGFSSNINIVNETSIYMEKNNGEEYLYVFSSPVCYQYRDNEYRLIDLQLSNIKENELREGGYIYKTAESDLETFYPKALSRTKGVLLKGRDGYEYEIGFDYKGTSLVKYREDNANFINNKRDMILYDNLLKDADIYLYPSYSGSNCEITFNSKPKSANIEMWLKLPENAQVKIEPIGYLRILLDNETIGVIQRPLIKTKNGSFFEDSKIKYEGIENGLHRIKLIIKSDILEEGSSLFLSFELNRSSQPDNAIYSNLPNINNSNLSNLSVIGNSEKYGYGCLMIRYYFTHYYGLNKNQIEKANFYCYSLTRTVDEYELLYILDDWCAINGNWAENYQIGERVDIQGNTKNELKFDITDPVKEWCEDDIGILESNGLLLKSTTEEYGANNILLSNDNTLYINKSVIRIRK